MTNSKLYLKELLETLENSGMDKKDAFEMMEDIIKNCSMEDLFDLAEDNNYCTQCYNENEFIQTDTNDGIVKCTSCGYEKWKGDNMNNQKIYPLRLPLELYDWAKIESQKLNISMNAFLVMTLSKVKNEG